MKIGYARVSTTDQKLDMQLDVLTKYGCKKIYQEKVSGKTKDRPELMNMIDNLRSGDTVVVWKLDRLGRSLKDLIYLVDAFRNKEVDFISVNDNIDTSTATGRLTFNIFASMAEFEREIISERTRAGLQAAKNRGRTGGRPSGLSKEKAIVANQIKKLYDSGDKVKELMSSYKLSRATIYRYISIKPAPKQDVAKAS